MNSTIFKPFFSSSPLTLMPIVLFIAQNMRSDRPKAQPKFTIRPRHWAPNCSIRLSQRRYCLSMNQGRSNTPQIPPTRWAGIALTTSSIPYLSRISVERSAQTPAMKPMITADKGWHQPDTAVTATRPPRTPLKMEIR